MKTSLFVTCLVDQFFPEVGLAAWDVLRRAGVEVVFDPRQTCCGQPAFNTGYDNQARRVARHFIDVFRDAEAIVTPSGSCATMVRKCLPGLFAEDSREHLEALAVAERTFELSEFLVGHLGLSGLGGSYPRRVTFHDSCHGLRELGIFEQPRLLIRAIQGIDFVEMTNSTRCCGFGGTFAVKFHEVSSALGRDKIESIRDTGADVVVSGDVSCLMHLRGLLQREQVPIEVMHLAQLLNQGT